MKAHALLLAMVAGAAAAAAENGPRDGFFTTSDGIRIHYLEAGSGVPVVLIHGYTGSAQGNWFVNGVAPALATDHRVVAIDCRGHGQSDKPHDPKMYGARMWQDVLELMDHLSIERAHVHGYSMGGGIVTALLAHRPERFITATYGGSGVREVDPEWQSKVPADPAGGDPQEEEARSTLQASPHRDEAALRAVREGFALDPGRGTIDLTTITLPVLAINGEFDAPNAKTHRMRRELANFESVVLPGKSHLTAIMAGYIPRRYIDAAVEFVRRHDSLHLPR